MSFVGLLGCYGAPAMAGPAGTLGAADWPDSRAVCQPVPLGEIQVGGFLGHRIERNRAALLAAMESALPRGFEARAQGKDLPPEANRLAADSDLYKWLEGACYYYAMTDDAEVRRQIDRVAGLIVRCQHPDGYINTQVPPRQRFDSRVNHDLYIAGHFFEAAVAHHRATGEHALLEAAARWADYLVAEYEKGNSYFKTVGEREHSEYELGLLRLSRETGRAAYLDLAMALAHLNRVGPRVADIRAGGGWHAVRVGYFLAGLADLYLETGQEDLARHLPALWEELVATRMYVTGAIGSHGEQISKNPFELPQWRDHPDRQLGETCACVAMMMFTWRMHALTGESRCFDVIERILYNHFLGSVSLDHLAHFYYNPMRMVGDLSRYTDHGQSPCTARCRLPALNRTTCCMPNIMRLFGALPEYVCAHDAEGIWINLFTTARLRHALSEGRVIELAMKTEYPRSGDIELRYEAKEATAFKLRVRIPRWCQLATVSVNEAAPVMTGGGDYYVMDRMWRPGDAVRLHLDMPVRMLTPHPRVAANAGQVVLARGPLVYCLESADTHVSVEQARVSLRPEEVPIQAEVAWREDLLGGVSVVQVPGSLAPSASEPAKPEMLRLIPWYARANRGDNARWVLFLPWVSR